jgi:hypothetical protein
VDSDPDNVEEIDTSKASEVFSSEAKIAQDQDASEAQEDASEVIPDLEVVVSAFLDLKESASEVKDASDPIASEASLQIQETASEVTLPSTACASIGKIEPKPLEKKFSDAIEAMLATASTLLNPEPIKEKSHGEGTFTSEDYHKEYLEKQRNKYPGPPERRGRGEKKAGC